MRCSAAICATSCMTPALPRSLEQTSFAQPALFVTELALAKLWQAFGIAPQASLGHSLGEYVAATLAGVWTPQQALRLVCRRGQLMRVHAGRRHAFGRAA